MPTLDELKLVPVSELLKAASERIKAFEEDKFEEYLLRPLVKNNDFFDLCQRFQSLLYFARLWVKDSSCDVVLRHAIENLAEIDVDRFPDELWDDAEQSGQLCDLAREHVTLQRRYNELQRLYRTRLEIIRAALIAAGVVKVPETITALFRSAEP